MHNLKALLPSDSFIFDKAMSEPITNAASLVELM